MIDIENVVFDTVRTAVKTVYSSAYVYGEYVDTPAGFPCVTIAEADNYVHEASRDSAGIEHYANVMYEVNVYCNDSNGKKAKAKAIASLVDTAMVGMNFTRTFMDHIPNVDRTIYRMTMRYTAVVSAGEISGTSTTHRIYRQ